MPAHSTPYSIFAMAMVSDGRFPTGGYSHSHGLEQAVLRGHLGAKDPMGALGRWLNTVLNTSALSGAAQCAWAARNASALPGQSNEATASPGAWKSLDLEIDARMISPRAREVSRALGKRHATNFLATWQGNPGAEPLVSLTSEVAAPHLSAAMGCTLGGFGIGAEEAAATWCYNALAAQVSAAIKLLGVDPVEAFGLLAGLGEELCSAVSEAADYSSLPASLLPSLGHPLADALLEEHWNRKDRLFAS